MFDLIDRLSLLLREQQPWLLNLAALATVLTLLLRPLYLAFQRALTSTDLSGQPMHQHRGPPLTLLRSTLRRFLRPLRLSPATPDRDAISNYLKDLAAALHDRNDGPPVSSRALNLSPGLHPHPVPSPGRDLGAIHIRRTLKLLVDASRPSHGLSAQLASLTHKARPIRNAVRTLQRAAEPLVLLGDPGSGKSYLLRHLAAQLAIVESRKPDPKLVVFVSIRNYTA